MIDTIEPTTESLIRETEVYELHEIARLGREFYDEAGSPCGEFISDEFVKSWTGYIEAGIGVIFQWRVEGEPVGVLGAICGPDPNNGDVTAIELFWFVSRPHRGGLPAFRLLKRFESWALDRGCRRVSMVNLENEQSRGLPAFYAKMGYKPVEVHYVKEL